jgi:hypothetical protein
VVTVVTILLMSFRIIKYYGITFKTLIHYVQQNLQKWKQPSEKFNDVKRIGICTLRKLKVNELYL